MIFMAVGMAALAYTVMRMIRKNRRTPRDARSGSEVISDLRTEAQFRGREQLTTLMADATELTQRLCAQLDAKAERLEQLLAEADRRLADLDHRDAAPPEQASMSARVHALADRGLTAVQIAQETGQPTGQIELILALRRRA